MKYVDANIFIYAAIDEEENGRKARAFLKRELTTGKKIITSLLSLDEITWKVRKKLGRQNATRVGKDLLDDPRIGMVNVTSPIMKKAFELMESYRLDPRDAIHAASCILSGADDFVSEDSDFQKISDIHAVNLIELEKEA